ncbi:MAG: acetyl-CoA decarbonylase/synthase complex subunit delta [Desulfobacteraceae bacterium]|nr:acetyl-CoA decarbonylase/synthase complex subunit delta [Desulfobacteraceae bacterium]MCF8094622.1 acetyl-CoA decarbonylase/synthase complex subunit delta [Desulfobacteraceae bacterium]
MGFEIFKETYAGSISPITLGKGDKAVTVGGESCLPLYTFEGEMPNKPRIAMEIWDMEPSDWAEPAKKPFEDVLSDPAAWAKKCVEDYGADMIVLQLKSADPNGKDASPDEIVATVKKVLEAINVPLILWGTANNQKDEEVLKKVSESCEGENLVLGPVEDDNHKGIGASAMGFGHTVISSSPIDVNLAKQVNILLENLGVPTDRIIIDPTTGGLGYGMEYSYSVMERIKMAALLQGDDKLQYPMINNLGNEVWRCKEANQSADEAPELGDPERRGILMEVAGAVSYLMAGSDILIMRHPESIRMVKSFIDLILEGGSAEDIAPISKQLADVDIDFASMAPEPDLTIEEEKKAAPKKAAAKKEEKKEEPKKAAPKKEEKKAEPAKEEKKAEPKKAEAKPAAEEKAARPEEDEAAKAKAEEEKKKKAEEEAKAKAEQEAKAKEEEEKKKKQEAEKKAKGEEEARKKAEAEKKAKREEEERKLREKRAKEREKLQKKREAAQEKPGTLTPAEEQKSHLDKIVERLDRIHRRA